MAAPTVQAGLAAFIPKFWDRKLGDNLRPSLFFYDLGEMRTLPANFGNTIRIPRILKQPDASPVIWAEGSEGAVTSTCPLSGEFISGTLKKFKGAYKHSDLVIMTALSDVMQLSIENISYALAKQMDLHIRNSISGAGIGHWLLANSATHGASFGGVSLAAVANTLRITDLIRAETILESRDNPRYPGTNKYAFVIHPRMKYDIQTPTSTTVGGWVEVNRYNNAEKIFNGEIGSLYGFKVVSTTNAKLRYGLSATAAASGAEAYALAPRAYYVTELSEMSARTYVKQLGSAGAADPTNDLATVGAKVFFTAIPGGNKFTGSTSATEYRLLHILGRTATAVTF